MRVMTGGSGNWCVVVSVKGIRIFVLLHTRLVEVKMMEKKRR